MKLSKIKLINWHLFTNHTIDLKGNVLITGENASGKSTLMDAIYYVLSAGDKKHFNKAANESGQRSLETYIRGKLGTEKRPFLRMGSDITSYIALQFNGNNNNNFCLAACIEIVDSSEPKSHFFALKDYKIEDIDFIENNKPLTYSQFKSRAKVNRLDLDELGETYKERSRKIGRDIFKLDNYKRFFDLLQNAISFKPISEVSSFVNSFLLQEDNINLDSLKEEIRSYQNIHTLLIKEKEKMEVLIPFIDKAEQFVRNKEELQYLKALQSECTINRFHSSLKRIEIEYQRAVDQIKLLEEKRKLIEQDLSERNTEIFQLENNEDYKALKQKQESLDDNNTKLKTYQKELDSFKEMLISESKIVRNLNLNYRFEEDFKEKDFGLLKAHLTNYGEDLKILRNELLHKKSRIEYKKEENKEKTNDLNSQLSDLNKGINNYPEDVRNLIELVHNAIETKYPGAKTIVRPFCEYLEMKDESWRNAIEAYLNTQRFNLIVEPKYYDVAISVFESYKKERKIYQCGIVNIAKINCSEPLDNSLYSKIKTENASSDIYAKYLLGQVVCVNNIAELKNHLNSITKDAIVYKNYVVRALNPKIYETPFIGQESIKTRILLLQKQIENCKKENNDYLKEIEKLDDKISSSNNSCLNDLLKQENLWQKIEYHEKRIEILNKEIENASKIGDLYEISMQIRLAKKRQEELKNNLIEIEKEQTDKNQYIGEIKANSKNINDSLNLEENNLKQTLSNLDQECYNDKKATYSQSNNLNKEKIESAIYSAQNYNNGVTSELIKTMQKYTNTYKPSLVAIIENIEDYINEYHTLANRDVVKYEIEAKEAYERAELSFREDFISKLHEKIETSQKMLDGLNDNLKLHPFGSDEETYRFYYEPTKDSEFYNYYRIIMSGKLMDSKDLFTEILDEKDNSFMNDLFNKISMETNGEQGEAELVKYLDYRNYMNYDIKITNKNGEESYFSKINKEKSGGETQTPFYIVMASCFDELMNKNNVKIESTCQVVFDEAFNNMDESRIKSLMEFYKRLNIQIIIVVPSNRISAIAPYMDTLIGIVKINNYPHVINMMENK